VSRENEKEKRGSEKRERSRKPRERAATHAVRNPEKNVEKTECAEKREEKAVVVKREREICTAGETVQVRPEAKRESAENE